MTETAAPGAAADSNEVALAEATTSPDETAPTPEETAATGADDCDNFLANYGAYADSYASLAAKYAKNPTDMSIMSEYTDMATQAQKMQESLPEACQADAAFLKRYTRITAKVSKAATAQAAGSAKLLEQMSK